MEGMAGTTGLEPATSDVTGRRSNQLNYVPVLAEPFQVNTTRTPSGLIGPEFFRAPLLWKTGVPSVS